MWFEAGEENMLNPRSELNQSTWSSNIDGRSAVFGRHVASYQINNISFVLILCPDSRSYYRNSLLPSIWIKWVATLSVEAPSRSRYHACFAQRCPCHYLPSTRPIHAVLFLWPYSYSAPHVSKPRTLWAVFPCKTPIGFQTLLENLIPHSHTARHSSRIPSQYPFISLHFHYMIQGASLGSSPFLWQLIKLLICLVQLFSHTCLSFID